MLWDRNGGRARENWFNEQLAEGKDKNGIDSVKFANQMGFDFVHTQVQLRSQDFHKEYNKLEALWINVDTKPEKRRDRGND
jgi:hypothetical protein